MIRLLAVAFFSMFLPWTILAESDSTSRITGEFKIDKITKISPDSYRIVFTNLDKSEPHETLFLDSNQIHMGLSEGQTLRLSAEVFQRNPKTWEITQVLVFLKTTNSHIPVWLISQTHGPKELRGARYIEMHAPTSDFLIL